jgi:coproporphyrinogen III oxidase-like Fe-S oxidoreductase
MRRQWNEPDLKGYIEDPTGCNGGEELTDEQLVIERIMLALRTSEGISEAYLREHCDQHELSRALAAGNLEPIENGMVRIPESHFFISDNIIASLI